MSVSKRGVYQSPAIGRNGRKTIGIHLDEICGYDSAHEGSQAIFTLAVLSGRVNRLTAALCGELRAGVLVCERQVPSIVARDLSPPFLVVGLRAESAGRLDPLVRKPRSFIGFAGRRRSEIMAPEMISWIRSNCPQGGSIQRFHSMDDDDLLTQRCFLGRRACKILRMQSPQRDLTTRYHEYLRVRGKPLTHERGWVLDSVLWTWTSFRPDEIVGWIADHASGRLSRATIYRSLLDMVDAGVLREEIGERYCRADLSRDG